MQTFEYTITDPVGIHARPAGLLAAEAKQLDSVIKITKDGKTAEAQKIMSLLGLGVRQGDRVTVTIEGSDEEAAAVRIETFFRENL